MELGRLIRDTRSCRFDRKQWDRTDIGARLYRTMEEGASPRIGVCREHIICPVFVARDLSGLGWPLKEGHYDMGTGATGGETDAL